MFAYQHRMTRIAKQGQLAILVDPCAQWGTVHKFPFERGGNECKEFLDPEWERRSVMRARPYGQDSSHPPRVPTHKVGSHLFSATFRYPRFHRTIVGMYHDKIKLFLGALCKMR